MHWLIVAALLAGGRLHEMDRSDIDATLRAMPRDASFEYRLLEAARLALGTPYFDGPLGEGPEGKYDSDPMVDFTRVDCVTYVEQSVAMATGSRYDEMYANLQRIRYRDGKTDFENRNHFMISDWVSNNPYCVDVSAKLGVQTQQLTRTISKKGFFELVKAPGLGADEPDEAVTIDLVPTAMAAIAQQNIPSPSLIVFVGKVDWLFSLHCGLYLRDADGRGRLYHGSSKGGGVVEMDLAEYMEQQQERYIGFTTYRIDEPKFSETAR